MVGQLHLRYKKIGDLYFRTMKNIVQLSSRRPTGVRWLPLTVRASKTRCCEKQLQFPITPENIEVAGNHYRFINIFDHSMKFLKLVLAMAKFQREVYKKNVEFLQL